MTAAWSPHHKQMAHWQRDQHCPLPCVMIDAELTGKSPHLCKGDDALFIHVPEVDGHGHLKTHNFGDSQNVRRDIPEHYA